MTTLTPLYTYGRRDPISAVFDDLIRGFGVAPAQRADAVRAIRFDVAEQGANYVVTADLPGFKKEEIQVEIDGARVTISAESKTETETREGERMLYSERRVGKAVRSFELGAEVDQATSVARYSDGVLTLTLPKKVAETRKLLAVQ